MNPSKVNTPRPARRWVLPLVAGGIISLSLAFVAGRGFQSDLTGLEQKVARLEKRGEKAPSAVREVRTIVHERTVEQAAAATPLPEPGASTPAERESDEEAQYRAEVIVEAQRKTLSDAFTNESADPAWSKQAAQTLQATYADPGLEAAVIQSECRSTMCRLTFRLTDPESSLDRFQQLKHLSPWPGYRHFTYDMETGEGTAYLARESYELPNVDVASLRL